MYCMWKCENNRKVSAQPPTMFFLLNLYIKQWFWGGNTNDANQKIKLHLQCFVKNTLKKSSVGFSVLPKDTSTGAQPALPEAKTSSPAWRQSSEHFLRLRDATRPKVVLWFFDQLIVSLDQITLEEQSLFKRSSMNHCDVTQTKSAHLTVQGPNSHGQTRKIWTRTHRCSSSPQSCPNLKRLFWVSTYYLYSTWTSSVFGPNPYLPLHRLIHFSARFTVQSRVLACEGDSKQ